MYLAKIPGYKNFFIFTALIVVFMGMAFNGIVMFFESFQKASRPYNYELVLTVPPYLSTDEVNQQLKHCSHVQVVTMNKTLKNRISVLIYTTQSVDCVKKNLKSFSPDISFQSITRSSLQDTFFDFLKGFSLLFLCVLSALIFFMMRYFIGSHYETFQIMAFLGVKRSNLIYQLQKKFALLYFLGICFGILCLKIGIYFGNLSAILTLSFHNYIRSYEGLMTFFVIPVLIFLIFLGVTNYVIDQRLKKLY